MVINSFERPTAK